MVCIGSSCGRSALHSKGREGAGRRAPISKPPWRRRLARSIVCGCIRSRSIEGRKGKGEVVAVVGVLRVHGGEEGLVLELVRVAGAAAAAAAVAGPAVASHSPWPLADTATRASTSQALASLSLSLSLPSGLGYGWEEGW